MPDRPRLAALLVLLGLLAVSNALWLFPHDGDVRRTYERSAISVEDGTFDYRGASMRRYHTENDLVDVGCQPGFDGVDRACAFDYRLLTEGPVTVPVDGLAGSPRFVELDGAYYRRVATVGDSGTTYDVERVPPERVLAEVATNVTATDAENVDGDAPLPIRVAATGEAVTTFERVEPDRLGRVYRRDGRYYTVVLTDETVVDRPLVSRRGRELLDLVGAALLLGGVVLVVGGLVDRTR